MRRPLWWYLLQIPGIVGIITFFFLVYAGLINENMFPKTIFDYLSVLGISGFGWICGSTLGSWIDAIKTKQRKWPNGLETFLLLISIVAFSPVCMVVRFLPWWAIATPLGFIAFYCLLWMFAPSAKPEEKKISTS